MRRSRTLLIALVALAWPLAAPTEARAEAQTKTTPPAGAQTQPRKLAIFLFEGVQIIDYTGPYEVFGQAWQNDKPLFDIYTVAEKAGPLTTSMGMTVIPKYTLGDAPPPDVIVLPGGGVRNHFDSPAVLDWIRKSAARAEIVLSVCNGAFYLAKAGLLDGLTATTFHGLIDDLQALAPKARIIRDQRFVDNGKIITAAGLSSGIDGALHVIERIAGRTKAQEVALGLEYNWQPDVRYARASFADYYLRKVLGRTGFDIPDGTPWKVLAQSGDTERWEKVWEVGLDWPATKLLPIVETALAKGWTRTGGTNGGDMVTSTWSFTGDGGSRWSATSVIQPIAGQRALKLSVRLMRDPEGHRPRQTAASR
jgi:putative intracellular protease/amidase